MKYPVAAILAVSCLGMPAEAQDAMPSLLAEALARSAVDGDPAEWEFTVSFRSDGGDLIARFDGSRPEQERWTLVSPAREEFNETHEEVWSDLTQDDEDDSGTLFFHVTDAEFDWDSATLVGETPEAVTFGFTPDASEAEEGDMVFLENIRGELTIDRDDAEVSQMRLYAPDSFKPHFAVRIREFEVVQTYSRIDGMPRPVLTRMTQNVRASAMMQNFNENFSIEFTDIRYSGN